MSGSNNVDHVSCSLNFSNAAALPFRRLSSPSASRDDPASSSSSSSPPPSLPSSTTYPAPPGLTESHPARGDVHRRSSPDPDDYYRAHTPAVAAGHDPVPSSHSGVAAKEKPPPSFQRVSSVPSHSLDPAVNLGPYRSVSDSTYRGVGSEAAKSASARVPIARPRQASFKDLVHKFNNNPDQVLPFPSPTATKSRSTSRAASPVSPADGPRRSRAASHWRDQQHESTTRDPLPRGLSTASLEQGPRHPSLVPPPLRTSESRAYPGISEPRKRVSGKFLSVDTGFLAPGYGTPSHLRRRGSEGTIPSPNPAFLDRLDPSPGVTPLTPTAWYLGRTPFLEEVNIGSNANYHRRVRSDLSGIWPGGTQPSESHMAVQTPLQMGTQTPLDSPHSKSRIPISSHRLNSPSGSGESSPISKTSPTFNNRAAAHVSTPPKGTSRLPKPSPRSPTSSDEDGPNPFAMTPRAKREMVHGRPRYHVPDRGHLLEAYIAAPPPKKSPPLRSSRPRQPVSHTTSPRQSTKVGQTVSSINQQLDRDQSSRSSRARERRMPELGNVDFATRRQRIQQAFNRTVQENERKEEKAAERRRQVQVEEDRDHTPAPPEQPEVNQSENAEVPNDAATVIEEPTESNDEGNTSTAQGDSRSLPQLHVDTDIPSEPDTGTPQRNLTTMDSPTLGQSNVNAKPESLAPKSAMPPISAVTAGSNVTTFDTEPQTGLSRQNLHESHKTLLNQIMQIRESSPSSSSCDDHECSFSENEERESIPIVLRDALGCDDSTDSGEVPADRARFMKQTTDAAANRWSMSSWSSSLRNQQSVTDDQCEGSGDDLQHCTEDSEIATQSCSAASSAPASVVGDQSHSLPVNNNTAPRTEPGNATQKHTYGYSNAPSLARLGGWDSKRVTQLYFEQLARGKAPQLPLAAVRASPEPRLRDSDKRADGRTDSLTEDPVVVSKSDIPASDRLGHSASLVLRDDWEHASPSIMDWMQVAADDGSAPQPTDNLDSRPDGAPTPRLIDPNRKPPHWEDRDSGLGLAINVQSPKEYDSQEHQPQHPQQQSSPAPADAVPENNADAVHQPQTIDLRKGPLPPAAAPTVTFAPLGQIRSTGSSEDSLRHREPSSSSQVDSSSTSLVPSTSEQPRQEVVKSPSPEQRRLKKRRHIIKELVDTEYTFGRDMKVVDDIYKGTSSSCLDLSSDDVKVLFANSDQVVQFSMAFQDTLKEAAKSVYVMPKSQRWSSKRGTRSGRTSKNEQDMPGTESSDFEKDSTTFIGQAFLAHVETMERVYADYLKNHDAANKKLQTLQKNPKVAIWLKECRDWASDLTTAWDLDSLLVKPVQRILKYPLLLAELIDSTPEDHPDRASLVSAMEEITSISVRINEMKKRADLVVQVVGRKRKESDVRAGLSKAFGRRTEKLRQQVGLSDLFEDKDYDALSQKFGDNFVQIQLVMRDADLYVEEAKGSMNNLLEFCSAIEAFCDVSATQFSELEGKWRDLKVAVQDILALSVPEHVAIVKKSVIDPMMTLVKLYEGPQRVMKKRDKRLMDYARFKSTKERGDKPDKKTTEQGEQFMALNETLKDELPKLYFLTAKLMEACLKNFVQIQTTWFHLLQEKLGPLVDSFPEDAQQVVNEWTALFNLSEAPVVSLGICNGSLLADTVNLVNFNTPSTQHTISSPRRPSTINSASTRNVDDSPKVSYDLGGRPFQSPSIDGQSYGRHRADSAFSGRAVPETHEIPRSQMLQQVTASSSGSVPPPSISNTESFPSLPRLSLDSPFLADVIGPSKPENHNSHNSHNPNPTPNPGPTPEEQPTSPAGRYSGFFSSAMPMSDNPQENTRPETDRPKEPNVLFLAASIYEFNIDRARREAGYPYLTYVAGEIFDVIAEKGELWLAKNQDDSTGQVGWIWNKHFAKLST